MWADLSFLLSISGRGTEGTRPVSSACSHLTWCVEGREQVDGDRLCPVRLDHLLAAPLMLGCSCQSLVGCGHRGPRTVGRALAVWP